MSTLKVTHLQNESNSAPSISISNAVGGGVTFAGISTFHGSIRLGTDIEGHTSADDLTIATSGDTGMTIRSGASNQGSLYFSDATSGNGEFAGWLRYSHQDSNMTIGVAENERLRLTSSGNVNIGPSANANDHGLLTLSQTDLSAFNALVIQQGNTLFTATDGLHIGIDAGVNAYFKLYENRDIYFTTGTSNTEKLRITSAGNVNIGPSFDTSSSSGFGIEHNISNVTNNRTGCIKLQADGNNNAYYNVLEVYNGNTQSCRIHANGSFIHGSLVAGGGGGGYISKDEVAQYANSTAASLFRGWDASGSSNVLRVQLKGNGGIANYQANDSNLCDEREKKNIVSLDSKWDKVKSWELKKFHYNEDADTDDLRYGVIAQQVETLCPEVISDWKKSEGVIRKGVKEQQMMWMGIKALQEAMAKIETLEAKVAALEGS